MDDLALPNANHLAGQRRRPLGEASLKGLGFSQPQHISRLGGKFHLVDDTGEYKLVPTFDPQLGAVLDCVIVDVNEHKSKIYFDRSKPFDPKQETPPLCFSDNGVAPSVNALQPQHETCAGCPQNVRGSAISELTGVEVWACKDQKKIAVIVSGTPGVWLFVIPPASLKKFRAYVEWVIKQQLPGAGRMADPADMVTRIYFNKEQPNILEFRAIGVITAEIAALQDKLLESGATDSIVGRNDQPRTKPLPALQGAPQQAIPAPQAPTQPPAQFIAPATFVLPTGTDTLQEAPKTISEQAVAVRKKRGRPPASDRQAVGEPAPADVPAFIQATQPKGQPPATFGIQQAQPASTDLAAAVRDAFKLA